MLVGAVVPLLSLYLSPLSRLVCAQDGVLATNLADNFHIAMDGFITVFSFMFI